MAYLFKIAYLIEMNNELNEVDGKPPSSINNDAAYWISVPLMNLFLGLLGSITANKLFNGGYIPYVPGQSDMNQMESLYQTVVERNFKLTNSQNTGSAKVLFSYYFLNFMQANLSIEEDQISEKKSRMTTLKETKENIGDLAMQSPFSDCPHPLKRCSFFYHHSNATYIDNRHNLLAKLHCHQCDHDILDVEGYFSQEDKNYTASRFDASFGSVYLILLSEVTLYHTNIHLDYLRNYLLIKIFKSLLFKGS